MRRVLTAALTFVIAASAVEGARAVFVDHSVNYIKHGYHANKMWPWPYVCPDRVAVREPFCIMINNGWRRQNLLGPHHFNPNTNQLTTAGELRVQWIMTQAPPDRRNIFVERTLDQDTNTARLSTVRDYAMRVSTDRREPLVAETSIMSEGRPASVVDATNVNFQKSLPAPMLPAAVDDGQ